MIVTLFKIEGCYFLLLFLVGLSIAPLSVSDRKEVMSIAHRWCLEDFDVVAFAYTPVHNSVRTISSVVYHTVLKKNPNGVILLYPSLTPSTHATLLHGPHNFLQVEIFFQTPLVLSFPLLFNVNAFDFLFPSSIPSHPLPFLSISYHTN